MLSAAMFGGSAADEECGAGAPTACDRSGGLEGRSLRSRRGRSGRLNGGQRNAILFNEELFAVLDRSVRIPPRQCLNLSIDYQMSIPTAAGINSRLRCTAIRIVSDAPDLDMRAGGIHPRRVADVRRNT